MFKKGELTTQQIVLLIILIVSFAVILIFIFALNPQEQTQKEICHNSVVLRDKTGVFSGPLDCRTNYVCISGGKDCEGFSSSEKVSVDLKNDGKNEERVMKAIADEMADCWWMFGQGNIKYADAGSLGGKEKMCALCSVIAFDDKIKELGPINYQKFYQELSTMKKDSTTYLDYLYSTKDFYSFDQTDFYIDNYLGNELNFDRQYFVLTGISKATLWGFFGAFDYGVVPVTILEKNQANYDKVGCYDYVAKA